MYEHNRRNSVVSCGNVSSEERFKFLEFLYSQFSSYNKDSDKIVLLDSWYVEKAKYINNRYNGKCIEVTFSKRKGIQKLAEVCSEINSQTSLNRVKVFVNEHPNFTDNDILILSK